MTVSPIPAIRGARQIGSLMGLVPSDVDPETARRAAEQILADPDFAGARPSLLARLGQWVLDGIAQVVAALGGGARGQVIGVVVLTVVVIAAVLVTARLVRRVRRDTSGQVTTPIGLHGQTAGQWRARAQRLFGEGDAAGALRSEYRALLAELVSAGLVDEIAGRTAQRYAREVALAAPEAAVPMRAVTAAFEATWYDRRPVTADDLAEMTRAATAVLRAARVPAARDWATQPSMART